MTKIFTQLPIKDNTEKLPFGILATDDTILRDVRYRTLSREEIKGIKDKKYIQRHPIEWLAKVICMVVESIDDIPIYAPYSASGFKVFPEIIHEIPSSDVFFLFIGGHIHNFGFIIKGLMGECGDCGKKQSFDSNLQPLKVDTDYEGNYHQFSVDLPDGFNIPDPSTKQNVLYKKIDFRMSVLGDALQFKDDYRPNGLGMFTEKIYANCVQAVYDESGGQLDPSRVMALMPAIFKSISGLDNDKIEEAFNDNIPQVTNIVKEICKNCSEDMDVFLQHGFLFTQRRLD
jgi:hypothetical protein